MTEPTISSIKLNETEIDSVTKTVTTLYFMGNDIFQAVEKIEPKVLDSDDKKLLTNAGVYKVVNNGAVDKSVVDYVNNEVKKISANTTSTQPDNGIVVNGEVNEDGDLSDKTQVNTKDVENILNNVKSMINQADDNNTYTITPDNEDNPIIKALKETNIEKHEDLIRFIDKVISNVTEDNIQSDKSAEDIAVTLVRKIYASSSDESVSEDISETHENENPVKKDVMAILEVAKINIVENDTVDGKTSYKITDNYKDSSIDLKSILDVVNAKITTDHPTLNLENLLTNAIKAADKYEYINENETKTAAKIAVELVTEASDTSLDVSSDTDTPDTPENSTETVQSSEKDVVVADEKEKDVVVADEKEKDVVVADEKNVMAILEVAKINIVENDTVDGKTSYKITDNYKDPSIDLNSILKAVNDKITTDHPTLNLENLLTNAIKAAPTYDYSRENTKTASEIAVELVKNATDTASKHGGKSNKYVYGGKTAKVYPKNISFSKKNHAKKRHNKKTIRKLQKLMNKRANIR